jgi:hypothetical protein
MATKYQNWLAAVFISTLSLPALAQGATRPAADSAACAPQAPSEVSARVEAMFAALKASDDKAMDAILAPDFYAFEGGRRFDRASLVEVIHSAIKAGKTYQWSITQPEAHATCHLAWITYRNQGQITDGENVQAVSWLESAVLRESHGHWLIAFLHSTRIREN